MIGAGCSLVPCDAEGVTARVEDGPKEKALVDAVDCGISRTLIGGATISSITRGVGVGGIILGSLPTGAYALSSSSRIGTNSFLLSASAMDAAMFWWM
jgi:hypothetical protein